MPVTPSYPGIYIEELPSNTHTITAAPTSITVFVGYTHPFKTLIPKTTITNFNKAIQIFSFTDYEKYFGGFYASSVLDSNVAQAVNQFFLNGGSSAYVIGVQPQEYFDKNQKPVGAVAPPAPQTTNGIQFTALEPTDSLNTEITVTITTPPNSTNSNVADITIIYGTNGIRVETYRQVSLDPGSPTTSNPSLTANNPTNPNFITTRINNISTLVTVAPNPTYPSTFTNGSVILSTTLPADAVSIFRESDFALIFQQDSDLDKVPIFNLLLLPGITDNSILSEALAFCERKQAFLIMDPPAIDVADQGTTQPWIGDYIDGTTCPKSQNGALYFPYLVSTDPLTGNSINLPPSGFVAGIYANTDLNRGVWKAPAGQATTLLNTTGVVDTGRMNDLRQGTLNLKGVNCLRSFPGIGTVVYGARTLVSANSAYQQWKYVPVRRMALFIEQTLLSNLGWVVFEPNDEPLWAAIRLSIGNFMLSLFKQGALQGSTPSQAFQVKCDSSTTTSDDQNNGIVNIIVAFAPLKPAEFVIVKIAQLAGQVQS
ncbi:MAG: phage tail sheath subtilisin-like domain-containing protein [Nostoc sp.]|uniref:phage tail sheath family protein n=1 Tax=Nostoc sp. TaxID=1180 RepID=UPI002FF353C1